MNAYELFHASLDQNIGRHLSDAAAKVGTVFYFQSQTVPRYGTVVGFYSEKDAVTVAEALQAVFDNHVANSFDAGFRPYSEIKLYGSQSGSSIRSYFNVKVAA